MKKSLRRIKSKFFDYGLNFGSLEPFEDAVFTVKELPRAMRPKLVVIWAYGDLFRDIFARQTP